MGMLGKTPEPQQGIPSGFSGTIHLLNYSNYARWYLACDFVCFNKRFTMGKITERITNAIRRCIPCIKRDLRNVEV